jgi:methyl-accepting chemotaxis protein
MRPAEPKVKKPSFIKLIRIEPKMKLRTTLLSFGGISIFALLLIGAVGYWGIILLNNSMNAIVTSSEALHASVLADQTHDALQSDVLGLKNALSENDRPALKEAQTAINQHGKSFLENMDIVANLATSNQIKTDLLVTRPKVDSYVAASKALRDMATEIENNPETATERMASFNRKMSEFNATFFVLEKEMAVLGDHIAAFNKSTQAVGNKAVGNGKIIIIVIFILTALGLIFLALLITRRTMDVLGCEPAQAKDIANSIAGGKLDNPVTLNAGDSTSLLSALNTMQTSLFGKQAAAINEMLRIKSALDATSINIRIADKDGNLIYLNPALINTLNKTQAEIRKKIPDFDANNILGRNVSMFYDDPHASLNILKNLRTERQADIVIGGRDYWLITNPILNANGEQDGTVGQWIDKTDELSTEQEVSDLVEAAATGDLSHRLNLDGKTGFFLNLSQSINDMVTSTDGVINETVSALERIANGDMTQLIETEYQGAYGVIKDNANLTVERLTDIVSEIKAIAHATNVSATEIAAGNIDLSQRTEEQASSLEETASSMEQMASTVKQNADNARQANLMATEASSVAMKGGQVVNKVVTTMAEINTSSKKIVDIISVIDGIAFQTNILALNAAVEAARAGEQGRGFAVVATEVRNLAQRSAAAAKEIKQLIGDSVDKVASGTKLVEQAGETMDEIVTAVKLVTDIVNEIAAASQEQSAGIDQVNNAITNMDEVTQQNAALVEEAAAAAASMEQQTQDLIDSVSVFQLPEAEQEIVRSTLSKATLRRMSQPKAIASTETKSREARLKEVEPRETKFSEAKPRKSNGKSSNSAPKEEEWEEF